ncbi:MAG: hypothetical protein K0R25_436 [Rickettsiaceae bacterium]|jgi:hypothetical protein|nr:hypothetical protein [Rickettsiaceae bacterium]
MPVIKMLLSLNKTKLFWKLLVLLPLGFLCSCQNSLTKANKNFLDQYGDQVEEINDRREAYQKLESQPKKNWKEPKDLFKIDNTETSRSAHIDTSQIVMPKPPEDFLPDQKTLLEGQQKELPESMFHIGYSPQNFPLSYDKPRLSFDDITIPKIDAFGIETELGEKNYQLVGNRALQRNIDFAKTLNEPGDREVSLEVIKKQKQSRKKLALKEKKKEKEDEKEEAKEEAKTPKLE